MTPPPPPRRRQLLRPAAAPLLLLAAASSLAAPAEPFSPPRPLPPPAPRAPTSGGDEFRLRCAKVDVPHRGATLYDVLGAPRTASRSELRRRFAELAKETHPDSVIGRDADDRRRPPSDRLFGEVSAAWRTLSDPEERRRYDLAIGIVPGFTDGPMMWNNEPEEWNTFEEFTSVRPTSLRTWEGGEGVAYMAEDLVMSLDASNMMDLDVGGAGATSGAEARARARARRKEGEERMMADLRRQREELEELERRATREWEAFERRMEERAAEEEASSAPPPPSSSFGVDDRAARAGGGAGDGDGESWDAEVWRLAAALAEGGAAIRGLADAVSALADMLPSDAASRAGGAGGGFSGEGMRP